MDLSEALKGGGRGAGRAPPHGPGRQAPPAPQPPAPPSPPPPDTRGGPAPAARAAAKDAVRKAPSDAKHRSVLFQLYCVQGNWEGARTQLKLVGDFDVEATIWVGNCEKVLACEASRQAVFAGKAAPTLFGKPPEWVGGTVEALRLGLEGNWSAAAASQAHALDMAPATEARLNEQDVAWGADGDSRLGPLLEAFVDGKYYWIPFEHIRAVTMSARTHMMDSIYAPAEFRWLNEGMAKGYIPVRYPGSEASTDAQIQLGRKTEWSEQTDNFFCGLGHRVFVTDAAEFDLAEIKSIEFMPHPVASSEEAVAEPEATEVGGQ